MKMIIGLAITVLVIALLVAAEWLSEHIDLVVGDEDDEVDEVDEEPEIWVPVQRIQRDDAEEMTANEYQAEALRTASGMNYENFGMLINAALGIAGEGGEVADLIKKATFQGHELDTAHVAKELGDVAWYLAVGAYAIGYDLDTVLRMNVEKLRARYPDGFDAERSLHREKGDV